MEVNVRAIFENCFWYFVNNRNLPALPCDLTRDIVHCVTGR